MLTLPALVFGSLLAVLYGSLFHFWKGGGLLRLLADLLLAFVGFWLGHGLANLQHWQWDLVGALHFGAATAGSLLFLAAGQALTPQPPATK